MIEQENEVVHERSCIIGRELTTSHLTQRWVSGEVKGTAAMCLIARPSIAPIGVDTLIQNRKHPENRLPASVVTPRDLVVVSVQSNSLTQSQL